MGKVDLNLSGYLSKLGEVRAAQLEQSQFSKIINKNSFLINIYKKLFQLFLGKITGSPVSADKSAAIYNSITILASSGFTKTGLPKATALTK